MTMTVVQKLYADGRIEDCNQKMTLAEMQAFVGGYIEPCPCSIPRRQLIVNENGLLHHTLPDNINATALVRPGVLIDRALRGDVLLVKAR